MIVLLEVIQPSLPTVCAVTPLPLSMTRMFPAVSKMTPRAAPIPPLTFVARHPLATVPLYLGAETPGHAAGTGRVECVGTGRVELAEVLGRTTDVLEMVEVGVA